MPENEDKRRKQYLFPESYKGENKLSTRIPINLIKLSLHCVGFLQIDDIW